MARRVFFSFHYERDAWRAGQVRNCNLLQIEDQYGFIDSVDWQSLEVQGRAAIERWIADQLDHTSVTVVLIGAETGARPWVRHEIVESWNRGTELSASGFTTSRTKILRRTSPAQTLLTTLNCQTVQSSPAYAKPMTGSLRTADTT